MPSASRGGGKGGGGEALDAQSLELGPARRPISAGMRRDGDMEGRAWIQVLSGKRGAIPQGDAKRYPPRGCEALSPAGRYSCPAPETEHRLTVFHHKVDLFTSRP